MQRKNSGGSLALYIGFTLMSLIEASVFIISPELRASVKNIGDLTIERRNPPIKSIPKILNSLLRKGKEKEISLSKVGNY